MLRVERIVVVVDSTYEVFLHTNLPDTQWPYDGKLVMKFRVSKDVDLRDYLTQHFSGVPVTRIKVK